MSGAGKKPHSGDEAALRRETLASLRRLRPSSSFELRLQHALDAAERDERGRLLKQLGLVAAILLPTVVLIVRLTRDNSPSLPEHVAYREQRIAQSGELRLDLSSSLELPANVYSDVTLHLPRAVHLTTLPSFARSTSRARCDARQCTVQLTGLTQALGELRIAVDQPGIYRLHIERSDGRHRRKDVLHPGSAGLTRSQPSRATDATVSGRHAENATA